MMFTHVYVLPIAIFVLMPTTFILTYIISVSLGHIPAEFPYISDTGTYSPESCIFSQLLNISALLICICGWVRFSQVKTAFGGQLEHSSVLRLNTISWWICVLCSFGISIISNFQETNVLVVHVLGAVLCFAPGISYIAIQTVISYQTSLCSKGVTKIRIAMTIIGGISFLVTVISTPIAFLLFHGNDVTKWNPNDGGFVCHVISTVSEWVLALGFNCYILTFAKEFQDIGIEPPHVVFGSLEVARRPLTETSQPTDDGYIPEADLYRPIVIQTEPYRELLA